MDATGDRVVLKAGLKRSALLEPGPAPARVVKRFHSPDLLDRLRDPLRARREYDMLRRCRSLGLPVPEPLDLRRSRGRWEVVMGYLDGTVPLDAWLRSAPAPGELERLAPALGHLLARLFAAGLDHGDLHPGNLLVRSGPDGTSRLWLTDLTKARLRSRLPSGRVHDCLVQLTAGVREACTDGVRKRALVALWRDLPESLREALPERGEWGRRVEDGARLFRRRDLLRRTRRWLRDSSSVEPYRDGRGEGFLNRTADPDLPERVRAALARHDEAERVRAAGTARAAGDPRPLRPLGLLGLLGLRLPAEEMCILHGASTEVLRETWRRQVRLFTHGIPCLPPLAFALAPTPWVALATRGATPLSERPPEPHDSESRQRVIASYGALLGSLRDRLLEAPHLGTEDLWCDARGHLRFGPLRDLTDRDAPPGPSSADARPVEAWSGPWSATDARAFRRAFAGALRHSSAERARIAPGRDA